MATRKIISATVEEVSPYDFDTSLANVKERIDEWIKKYGADARLDWDANFYYPYEQNPSPRYTLKIQRPENDEELEKRTAQEKKWQDEREARDRAEYDRLKKQFGDKK
jgi:hypothetical protein